MALDAYSLCPGGTGKKIKFCCPDFLPELEKIDRMIEGEQFIACHPTYRSARAEGPIPGLPDGDQVGIAAGDQSTRPGAGLCGRFRRAFSAKLRGLVRIGPAYRGLGRRPGRHGQAAAGNRAVRRQYSKPRLRGGRRCRQRADPGRPLGGRPGLAPVSGHVGPGRSRDPGTADFTSIAPPRFPCC